MKINTTCKGRFAIMSILIGLLIAAAVLVVLWMWAIAPNMNNREKLKELAKFDYAHRGLHNNQNGIPENSLKAFRLAAEAGFGMELDVQLTKDDKVVVHHDGHLQRTCGSSGVIRDLTYDELQRYRLFGTEEGIPLFTDTLQAVGRRVPLIVEIKGYSPAEKICPLVWEILKDYQGLYCVESFDPRVVRWFRQHHPEVVRGQLMVKMAPSHDVSVMAAFVGTNMLMDFVTRPDFEAYDFHSRNNPSLRLARTVFGMQEVSWTLNNPKDYETAKRDGAICIFEGFVPNEPQTDGKKSALEEARTAAAALITVKNP